MNSASALTNATFNLGVGAGALVGSALITVAGLRWLSPVAAAIVLVGLLMVLLNRRYAFPSPAVSAERADVH